MNSGITGIQPVSKLTKPCLVNFLNLRWKSLIRIKFFFRQKEKEEPQPMLPVWVGKYLPLISVLKLN